MNEMSDLIFWYFSYFFVKTYVVDTHNTGEAKNIHLDIPLYLNFVYTLIIPTQPTYTNLAHFDW